MSYAQDIIDHLAENNRACLTTLRNLGDPYGYSKEQKQAVIDELVAYDCVSIKTLGRRKDYTLTHGSNIAQDYIDIFDAQAELD